MATPARRLYRQLHQISRTIPAKRKSFQSSFQPVRQQKCRAFTSTARWCEDEPASTNKQSRENSKEQRINTILVDSDEVNGEQELQDHEYLTPAAPIKASDLLPDERAHYDLLPKDEQAQYIKLQNHFKAIFESSEVTADMDQLADEADKEIERMGDEVSLDFDTARVNRKELGFWGEDEDDEFGQMEDADDDMSDEYLTSVAESELDLHRDVRTYTRIVAWDLPLLQQYAKPFQAPDQSTPLRFRYTTYMGETHPAQHKVVVEFTTQDLLKHPSAEYRLSEAQRNKLIKLVGVRYNPTKDIVRMSSEKFSSAAQNKRYLGTLITNLIKESKDKRDMFEDIPFDFRHHKVVTKPQFPEHWKLKDSKTVERLASLRETQKLIPEPKHDEGQTAADVVVDGDVLVKQYVRTGAGASAKQAAALLR